MQNTGIIKREIVKKKLKMPIKYASKYPKKYFNPNWTNFSHSKITWESHYGKGATTPRPNPSTPRPDKPTNKSSSSNK